MVTYPIEFPDIALSGITIQPRDAVSSTESPFTFSTKTYDWGGEMWTMSGSLPLMTRQNASLLKAFLLKLKGKHGTFLFPVIEKTPQGVASGIPVVNGGSQTGSVLNISGFTASTAGIVKAGDWLQLGTGANTELKMVLDDADSDGSGDASLNIWPSIRNSPIDGNAVVFNNCKGLFRLNENFGWSKDINKHFSMEFAAMEAINA